MACYSSAESAATMKPVALPVVLVLWLTGAVQEGMWLPYTVRLGHERFR